MDGNPQSSASLLSYDSEVFLQAANIEADQLVWFAHISALQRSLMHINIMAIIVVSLYVQLIGSKRGKEKLKNSITGQFLK